MCFIIALTLLVRIDGKPLLDFKMVAAKGMMWEALILTAAMQPTVNYLTSEATGVKAFLVQLLNPLLGGHSLFVFMVLIIILAVIVTNMANNVVTGIMFIPIVVSFAQVYNTDPLPMIILLITAVHMAILTPASCPFAALLFSNTGWVKAKDIYKYGSITIILMVLILCTFGYIWAYILF